MFSQTINYLDGIFDYLKSSVESITNSLNATKDVLVTLGNIIATLSQILGFIGFRVCILLITTSFIIWILNFISPTNKKINYIIAICLVVWMAISAKMPLQIVVIKYILLITSPIIITLTTNIFIICIKKIYFFFNHNKDYILTKYNFRFFKRTKTFLGKEISLLLTSDLPTKNEIFETKNKMAKLNYNIFIANEEKIFLTNENESIIFDTSSQFSQLKNSLNNKKINVLWFWSNSYGANRIIPFLKSAKKIKQRQEIIGSGDNSYILLYMQIKWNWQIIYGNNLKLFNLSKNNLTNFNYEISIINDFNFTENSILKFKLFGGDVLSVNDFILNQNFFHFSKNALFLDINLINEMIFDNFLFSLATYIINHSITPKTIIFGKIFLENKANYSKILMDFNDFLKKNSVFIPIFAISDFNFIKLNTKYIITYRKEKLNLVMLNHSE